MKGIKIIGLALILLVLLLPSVSAGFFINNDFPFIHYESKPSWGIDISGGTASWEKEGYGLLESPIEYRGFNGNLETRYNSEITGLVDICYAFSEDPTMTDIYVWENISHFKSIWNLETIEQSYICNYNLTIDKGIANCITENQSILFQSAYTSIDGKTINYEVEINRQSSTEVYYYDWVKKPTIKKEKDVKDLGQYWYCIEDYYVETDETYALKSEAIADINKPTRTIEYSIYVQPSGKDFDEAISDRDYMALDPDFIASSVRRTHINITNNLGFAANLTYNISIDLSTFTSANITIVNESGANARPFVNMSLMNGNSTAWIFIDFPNLPTGTTTWYIYEMETAQTTYNFENFTSPIYSDAGHKPDSSSMSDYGWSVGTGATFTYLVAKNHVGLNSAGMYNNAGGAEDRMTRSDLGAAANTTTFAWWYQDGAEAEEWFGPYNAGQCYCGTISGKSATNYVCNQGSGTADTGVSFGSNGWKFLKLDVNSAGTAGTFWGDMQKIASCSEADVSLGLQSSAGSETQFDDIVATRYYNADQPTYIQGGTEAATPANSPPSIDVFVINTTSISNTNYTNESINLYLEFSDTDADSFNYTVRWYKDTVLQTDLNDFNGSIAVHYGNTTKGENWTAYVNATDGSDSNLGYRKIDIRNAPPQKPTSYTPNITIWTWLESYNLSCSGSTDIDSDTLKYEFWVNGTGLAIQQNTTMQTYKYVFDNGNDTYLWNCRANDGTITSSWVADNTSLKWNNSIFSGEEEGHNEPIQSGTDKNYNINFSKSWVRTDRVLATMTIDGTTYTPTSTNISSLNKTTFNVTYSPPLNTSDYVTSFYWNVTAYFTNGSYQDYQYSYTQNVSGIELHTRCTSSNATTWAVLNLTLRDEVNESIQNGNIEATFVLWADGDPISTNITRTLDLTDLNQTFVCLTPLDEGDNYRTYTTIQYVGEGFDPRERYFINATLNNQTDNVNLYLLLIDLATGIKHIVQTETETALTGFYILVQRQDIGTNTFKLVAMGKTDNDGEDNIYLRGGSSATADTFYRHIIQNNTEVVFVSEPRKIKDSPIIFTIIQNPYIDSLERMQDITYSLAFNNDTKNFILTYSNVDGTTTELCLMVDKYSVSNRSEGQVCDTCTTSASGTLLCDIGEGTGYWVAKAYANDKGTSLLIDTLVWAEGQYSDFTSRLGGEGLILVLIFAGFIAFSGFVNPFVSLFLLIIALIILAVLQIFAIQYLAVLILAIIIAIIVGVAKS